MQSMDLQKILVALSEAGIAHAGTLATLTGLDHDTVYSYLSQLENHGSVRSHTADYGIFRLGRPNRFWRLA